MDLNCGTEMTDNSAVENRNASARRPRSTGSVLVEFALIFPVLAVLCFCMIDISRAFWIKNVTTQAAREGVRWGVVHTLADTAGVRSRVQPYIEQVGATLSRCDFGAKADQDTVRVEAQFNWLYISMFNFWLGQSLKNPATLEATATMRREG